MTDNKVKLKNKDFVKNYVTKIIIVKSSKNLFQKISNALNNHHSKFKISSYWKPLPPSARNLV